MSRTQLIDALRSPVRPTVSVEFFPPKDAEGGARMVWTDYQAQKSAPMPDWFRAHLV